MLAKISRWIVATALLSLLLCLPAQARQVEVSTSVLCNTEQQMERFVVLFDGDNEKAINGSIWRRRTLTPASAAPSLISAGLRSQQPETAAGRSTS